MSILLRNARLRNARFEGFVTLSRTITVAYHAATDAAGYRTSPAVGSLSDDSFGADTITDLFQSIGGRFFLRIDNDALSQDVFTTLSVATAHLGVIHLASADVVFFGGTGFSSWEWEVAQDLYRSTDAGQVLGWIIE